MEGVDTKSWLVLMVFLLVTLAGGSLASFLTARGVREWYPGLRKPRGTPPGWVFGPVWTALYVLMAVAAWLVWCDYGWAGGRPALLVFFAQLGLNIAWSGIFFGARLPGVAFAEIVLLWLAILLNIVIFHWLTPMAALLMVPYLTWVTYASYVNFGTWRLNRQVNA
jgi:tryptophan-rich sensory protein